MNFFQPSDHSTLTSRLTRLTAALLEHFLALSTLASWEAKQGFQQTLLCFFLLLLVLIFGLIGYFLLLTVFVITATTLWHLGLLLTLSLLALSHFFIAGILLLVVYRKRSISFFKRTRDELLSDIAALNRG